MTLSTGEDDRPEERDGLQSDVTRDTLARAIVELAEENDIEIPDAETLDRVQSDIRHLQTELEETNAAVDETDAQLDAVRSDVDALRSTLDEKVDDVRERVIGVLKETESKAPKDHTHPSLTDELTDLGSDVEELSIRIDELHDELHDELAGIEATNEAVDRHDDQLEEVDSKLTRVAKAVVSVQRRLGRLETHQAERDALAELITAANREGVTTAKCESCERSVQIGLLARAACPHCQSRFESVEPKSGFFKSAWLTTGAPPALEGGTEEATDAAAILGETDD